MPDERDERIRTLERQLAALDESFDEVVRQRDEWRVRALSAEKLARDVSRGAIQAIPETPDA